MAVPSVSSKRGRGSLSVPARAIFELLTLAALIVPAVWTAQHWHQFPVLIPEHFGLDGIADRTGLRSHLWFTPCAAAFIYVLLGCFSFFPEIYNLPAAVGHPDRPRLEHLGIEMMLTLRLELVTIFGLLTLGRDFSALTARAAFSPWVVFTFPLVVLLTLGLFAWEMLRARRDAGVQRGADARA